MKKLLVALLLLYPLSAVALTYEWTDENGTVNFTEDLGKVPKKYRKKAKVLGAEENGPQTTIESGEPAKKTKPEAAGEKKKLYGGKDGQSWRKEFAAAKGQVKATESQLADLRGRLADTSKMSRGEYLSIQNTIKHNETILKGQQQKLDELQESADRAGVPAEFRQ